MCVEVINGMADTIADLERKLAEREWVPVSERLAEYPCIVTDAHGNQPFIPMGIVTVEDKEHGKWQIDGRLVDQPKAFIDGKAGNLFTWENRILAWMPLPEPYKGGDTE